MLNGIEGHLTFSLKCDGPIDRSAMDDFFVVVNPEYILIAKGDVVEHEGSQNSNYRPDGYFYSFMLNQD